MAAMTVLSASVRAGVLAFGIGLAALAIPQLLDTAAAETTDAAPAAASTTDAARPALAARPAEQKARAARGGSPLPAAPPAPAPTATRTTVDAPSATPASTRTPLPATPRYRMLDTPASAAPRLPAPALGRWIDGTYVYFYNRTDQTLAVVQVPKGGRDDPEAEPRYLAPNEKSDFYGDNDGLTKMDVRLRIYTAVQDSGGAWQKGDLSEIITATNAAGLYPYARVHMDPFFTPASGAGPYNKALQKFLSVKENWFADYNLKGSIQSGQTGTYVVRLSDRKDDYKVFQIEVFKIPQGTTQDYEYMLA